MRGGPRRDRRGRGDAGRPPPGHRRLAAGQGPRHPAGACRTSRRACKTNAELAELLERIWTLLARPMIAAVSTLGDFAQTVGVVAAALLAAVVAAARSDRAPLGRDARRARPDARPARREHLVDAAVRAAARPAAARARRRGRRACVVLALGAFAIHRRPELLALAAAVALPFRVPIESRRRHGEPARPAVPRDRRGRAGLRDAAAARAARASTTTSRGGRHERALLEWLLAGDDRALRRAGGVLERLRPRADAGRSSSTSRSRCCTRCSCGSAWTQRLAGRCLPCCSCSRPRSSAIGFVEYAQRELLLNPKVISSNQFESYFRVNSLFFDPNIYGRFLVTVMLGLAALLLWCRRTAARGGRARRARRCCGRGSC